MGQLCGFKYSKTVKFAVYIIMEPTGRIFETETNLPVQCWSVADESSENKISVHVEAVSDSVSQFYSE